MKLSLRTRGIAVLLALVAYVSVTALVLNGERQRLLQVALDLERVHEQEAALAKANHAINHSLLRMQGLLFSDSLGPSFGDDLALDVELIQSGLQGLQRHFPEFDDDIARLGLDIVELREFPSRGGVLALQTEERALDIRLAELDGSLREVRAGLWARFYQVYDRMTLLGLTMSLVGIVIFGTMISVFFTRLAWDVRKVEQRAMSVADGYRGPPLEVTRTDEIGRLMEGVNRMQLELREREQRLDVAREQYFHGEKMAALGSIAAAVAHEINNPIAAIAGIAQAMAEGDGAASEVARGPVTSGPALILEQTQRISTISRQIAEFTRPPMSKPELLDLNGLVRNTCKFIGYDRRLRHADVVLELDRELPAVNAIADHLTQVLMNLIINAADALEGVADRKPTIRVATREADGQVVMSVSDNGHGMDSATLARAFEESFSTKPSDKGRGLGLFLCKSLVERGGGRIEMESAPGRGATVTVHLPLETAALT